MEAQALPFGFKETKERTNFYFRVKDTELAKKPLERELTDIKKNPLMILRKPNTMTFDERLAYTA
ncbi:PcfB protein, partial [Enterococcus faecalis]